MGRFQVWFSSQNLEVIKSWLTQLGSLLFTRTENDTNTDRYFTTWIRRWKAPDFTTWMHAFSWPDHHSRALIIVWQDFAYPRGNIRSTKKPWSSIITTPTAGSISRRDHTDAGTAATDAYTSWATRLRFKYSVFASLKRIRTRFHSRLQLSPQFLLACPLETCECWQQIQCLQLSAGSSNSSKSHRPQMTEYWRHWVYPRALKQWAGRCMGCLGCLIFGDQNFNGRITMASSTRNEFRQKYWTQLSMTW